MSSCNCVHCRFIRAAKISAEQLADAGYNVQAAIEALPEMLAVLAAVEEMLTTLRAALAKTKT